MGLVGHHPGVFQRSLVDQTFNQIRAFSLLHKAAATEDADTTKQSPSGPRSVAKCGLSDCSTPLLDKDALPRREGVRGRLHLKQIFKAGNKKTTCLETPRGRRMLFVVPPPSPGGSRGRVRAAISFGRSRVLGRFRPGPAEFIYFVSCILDGPDRPNTTQLY